MDDILFNIRVTYSIIGLLVLAIGVFAIRGVYEVEKLNKKINK